MHTMTAVHLAHVKVGWSAKAVITLDFVSDEGDIAGVAIEKLNKNGCQC